MIGNPNKWQKLGLIVAPDPELKWMSTFTGASFALPTEESETFDLYITGRDEANRSHIGKIKIQIRDTIRVLEKSPHPVFSPGELGAFDENGVSYPAMVRTNDSIYMYYVGWMPTQLAPFQNHTGLARCPVGTDDFTRVSRAPILPRTNDEPFCTGSVCVLKESEQWRMWYTVWKRWGSEPEDHKHYYVIRHAYSSNGIDWVRGEHNCIDYKNDGEYAIGKPSVIKQNGIYHMWYVYRGEAYRIGYAHSEDGIYWNRRDELAGIELSEEGWDSKSICYPHVIERNDHLLMFYCGNEYGKDGLGVAKLAK